ncbi:hypothetical protein BpHYR1_028610 [Brachionus plicatilis]|uniref:Uncharacterized protein n=1 Tax=Brachionus plicatilis TaxID=10195 RepID=A0A3M7Q8H5_BRAPC|nr:hypothetical protein BpHYR1_028610 [Brachionus plicatilis]
MQNFMLDCLSFSLMSLLRLQNFGFINGLMMDNIGRLNRKRVAIPCDYAAVPSGIKCLSRNSP